MCYPNVHSVHRKPIPYLGGVAIYLASVLAMLAFPPNDRVALYSVIVGGFIILGVGVVDDLWELTPMRKLLGQCLSGRRHLDRSQHFVCDELPVR